MKTDMTERILLPGWRSGVARWVWVPQPSRRLQYICRAPGSLSLLLARRCPTRPASAAGLPDGIMDGMAATTRHARSSARPWAITGTASLPSGISAALRGRRLRSVPYRPPALPDRAWERTLVLLEARGASQGLAGALVPHRTAGRTPHRCG